jgi:hypothetical protein
MALREKREGEQRDDVPPSPLAMVMLSSISAQSPFSFSFLSTLISQMYFLICAHVLFLGEDGVYQPQIDELVFLSPYIHYPSLNSVCLFNTNICCF